MNRENTRTLSSQPEVKYERQTFLSLENIPLNFADATAVRSTFNTCSMVLYIIDQNQIEKPSNIYNKTDVWQYRTHTYQMMNYQHNHKPCSECL